MVKMLACIILIIITYVFFWEFGLAGPIESIAADIKSIAADIKNVTGDIRRLTDGMMNGTIPKLNISSTIIGSPQGNL